MRIKFIFLCSFSCKINIEWTVQKDDNIKQLFPFKNRSFRPLVRITTTVSNFLTRYRTIVFFKEENNLSG